MKRALILMVASTMWIGCGSSTPQWPCKGTTNGLWPDLEGTWIGMSTYAVQGYAPWSSAEQTTIAVSGHSLTSSSVCPSGGGSPITASGWDFFADWSGLHVCPPVSAPGVCPSTVVTFTSGSIDLYCAAGVLFEQWQGTAVGCGLALEVARTFVGQKARSSGLNPAFSRTWKGTATTTVSGQAPIIIDPAEIAVAVSGSVAAVSGFCEGGAPLFLMTGSGNHAGMANGVIGWSCPPQALFNCPSVTVSYGSVTINLSANNSTLTGQGSGDASGCGARWDLTYNFTGT